MAAVAARTQRATIGHLVGANTFRNPALLAKMVTTIDHISGGRAVLGIGAAWMEPEHRAFGFEYGDRPGTRLKWLAEALPIIRGMLDGTMPSAPEGGRYAMQSVRNDPPPVQRHVPIIIGGTGRKVTLKLVAQYADMNNLGNPIEGLLDAEAAIVGHCETLGRDERTIERTVEIQRVVIRDSTDAAWARERGVARPQRRCSARRGPTGIRRGGHQPRRRRHARRGLRPAAPVRGGRVSPPHLRLPASL